MNDDHYTDTPGSYYAMRFSGTQARLYGTVASHHGIAGVSIDDGPETNVEYYAATRQEQVLLYTSAVLARGRHSLKVRATGLKTPAATGIYIAADRVDAVP